MCVLIHMLPKRPPPTTRLAAALVAGLVVLCAGCGKKPPTPPQPQWKFEPRAIQVKCVADPMLNVYEDKPHTLLMVLYQLSDGNAFSDQAKTPDGIRTLLQAAHFDQSVMSVDKFFIQPGEEKTITLYRAQNAQYVGVAAGYYQLMPGAVNRILSIPVIIEKQGLILKTATARVDHLKVTLYLGQRAMQEIDPYKSLDGE